MQQPRVDVQHFAFDRQRGEQTDRAPLANQGQRLFLRLIRRSRHDAHVRTQPVFGLRGNDGSEVRLRGIHAHIAKRFCLRETRGIRLGENNLRSTLSPGNERVEQPHRPCPKNQHHVAGIHIALLNRVDSAADRFCQGSVGSGHIHRRSDNVSARDSLGGDRTPPGHPAIVAKAHRLDVRTEVSPASPTVEAQAAGYGRRHHDPIAHRQPFRLG